MRNFKKCGSLLVHGFGKVSETRILLALTTLASILANNSFWLRALEDLVKNKNKSQNTSNLFTSPHIHNCLFAIYQHCAAWRHALG